MGVLASSVWGVFTEFLLRAGHARAGAGRVTSSPSWGSEPRGRPVRGARTHTGARGSAAPRRASVPPAADWSSQSLRGVSRRPVRSARHARNGPRHDAPGPRSHARSGAGTLVAGTPQEASTLPAPAGQRRLQLTACSRPGSPSARRQVASWGAEGSCWS